MKNKLELKYGIIIGLLAVVWLLLEYAFGLHDKYHDIFLKVTHFVLIIPAIGIYRALSIKKKQLLNGQLSFKQGFTSGSIISVVYSVIAALGQFCYHTFINKGYFDLMISKSQDMGASAEEAKAYFNTTTYVLGVLFTYLFFGILITLIYSLILKSKKA